MEDQKSVIEKAITHSTFKSERQLAIDIGVTPQTFSNWLNREGRRIPAEWVPVVAERLNIDPATLDKKLTEDWVAALRSKKKLNEPKNYRSETVRFADLYENLAKNQKEIIASLFQTWFGEIEGSATIKKTRSGKEKNESR